MAKKPKPPPALILNIRKHVDGVPKDWCGVSLIERDGPTDSGLLFGEMPPQRAEALAERFAALGIVTEREEQPGASEPQGGSLFA